MDAPYYQPLIAYPNPWSSSTNGPQKALVVLVSPQHSIDIEYLRKNLHQFKRKFILVVSDLHDPEAIFKPAARRYTAEELANMPESDMVDRAFVERHAKFDELLNKIDQLLKKSGALAVINASGSSNNGALFVQGHNGYKLSVPNGLPSVSMALEDGQKIKRIIQSGQAVTLNLNIKAMFDLKHTEGNNIIAEIPGSDPQLKSEVVMLGGHLDSWTTATGATDNAAGCAVMMEAVRLLKSLNLKPKRTIRIALWDGEEQGLYGSFNYAKNHFRSADGKIKPEQAKVSAYFNLDNGSGKIRGVYTQQNAAIKPIFEQWLLPLHDLGATTITLNSTGQTDHVSFDWAGIPGFQFIQDPIDYETRTHHKNMDNYDHLQIDDLKQAAIIIASFVYQTANRAKLLPRKPVINERFLFEQ